MIILVDFAKDVLFFSLSGLFKPSVIINDIWLFLYLNLSIIA